MWFNIVPLGHHELHALLQYTLLGISKDSRGGKGYMLDASHAVSDAKD